MPSEFEQKYLKSLKYWINSITIDAINSTIDIELITNPETQNIDAQLKFTEIIEYTGVYHEYDSFSKFDPNYLSSLLGIFSIATKKGIKYIVTTDTVEIILIAKTQPEIFWFN